MQPDTPDSFGASILGLQMQGGELQRLSPNSTNDEQVATLNSIIDHLNNMLKVQIYSDTGSKRYVQGYSPGRWPGGDFGIAISREGEDVLSASFEDLIFAWDFSTNIQYVRGGGQVIDEGEIVHNGGTQTINGGKVVSNGGREEVYGGTTFYYDPTSGLNVGQIGILPNGIQGQAWAKDGESVDDAIT